MTARAGTLIPACRILPRTSARSRPENGCSCCWSSPRSCRRCPPAARRARDLLEQVPECQSPLFLAVEVDDDGTVHLFFDAPREAPTTRGFAGILYAGLDGLGADEILTTPGEFSSQLGLQDLVSPLRLRGMATMLARIKRQVREQRGLTIPAGDPMAAS